MNLWFCIWQQNREGTYGSHKVESLITLSSVVSAAQFHVPQSTDSLD